MYPNVWNAKEDGKPDPWPSEQFGPAFPIASSVAKIACVDVIVANLSEACGRLLMT